MHTSVHQFYNSPTLFCPYPVIVFFEDKNIHTLLQQTSYINTCPHHYYTSQILPHTAVIHIPTLCYYLAEWMHYLLRQTNLLPFCLSNREKNLIKVHSDPFIHIQLCDGMKEKTEYRNPIQPLQKSKNAHAITGWGWPPVSHQDSLKVHMAFGKKKKKKLCN